MKCSICGIEVERKSNIQKYCKNCARIIKNKNSSKYYNLNKERYINNQKKGRCVDCSKKINEKSKRCIICYHKNRRLRKGHENKEYKVGDFTKLCNCGCGKKILYKKIYSYYGIPRYIKGHHPSWNKGLNKFSNGGVRKISNKKMGSKNPMWNGGSSFEPYDKGFNGKFKREIRERDNQSCMLCGIKRENLKKELDVHHINYDKKLTIPPNCISLCISCHLKTNVNRKHWIRFFQDLLSKRYGYKYYRSGKIKVLNQEKIE